MTERGLDALVRCRRREREQTAFYRLLAQEAEARGDGPAAERLAGLHADEQHHVSRLTARILELGGLPGPVPDEEGLRVRYEEWEVEARSREAAEVEEYEALLREELDPETRTLVEEILASERHHLRELGGKWMPA